MNSEGTGFNGFFSSIGYPGFNRSESEEEVKREDAADVATGVFNRDDGAGLRVRSDNEEEVRQRDDAVDDDFLDYDSSIGAQLGRTLNYAAARTLDACDYTGITAACDTVATGVTQAARAAGVISSEEKKNAIQLLHAQIGDQAQTLLDINLTTVTVEELGRAITAAKKRSAGFSRQVSLIYLYSVSFGVMDTPMKQLEKHAGSFAKLIKQYESYHAELAKIEAATQGFDEYRGVHIQNVEAKLGTATTVRRIQNNLTRYWPNTLNSMELRAVDQKFCELENSLLEIQPAHTRAGYELNLLKAGEIQRCYREAAAYRDLFRKNNASVFEILDARIAVLNDRLILMDALLRTQHKYMQSCEAFLEQQAFMLAVQTQSRGPLVASYKEAILIFTVCREVSDLADR